ncbi:unnamed protein product, partial [Mycena citricolor]
DSQSLSPAPPCPSTACPLHAQNGSCAFRHPQCHPPEHPLSPPVPLCPRRLLHRHLARRERERARERTARGPSSSAAGAEPVSGPAAARDQSAAGGAARAAGHGVPLPRRRLGRGDRPSHAGVRCAGDGEGAGDAADVWDVWGVCADQRCRCGEGPAGAEW